MLTPRMDFAGAKIKSVIDYKVLCACYFTDLLHSGPAAWGGPGVLVSSALQTRRLLFHSSCPKWEKGLAHISFVREGLELWKSR